MSQPQPDEQQLFVMALVSGKTLEPAVQIELGGIRTQLSAEKAREVALMILEASESAMSDSFLVQFIVNKTGAPVDAAIGAILQEFREFRDRQQQREQQP